MPYALGHSPACKSTDAGFQVDNGIPTTSIALVYVPMASTTFHIIDSAVTRGLGKARDDSSILATHLAQTQTDYLDCDWEIDEAFVGRTWRLVIACKDTVSQSRRKENALWRLWFQRKMGLGKLDPSSINW